MHRYYVTTPIYYVNGAPHIGSAYTTALADTLNRFYKCAGYETFFLTGTDEHGDKVQQAAEEKGRSALDFATEIANLFRATWDKFGFKYSRFIRTTEKQHIELVQGILQKIFDQGDIYFDEYGGNYCFGCERFLTDKELVDGRCPDHQTVPTYVKEANYFFRMSKYTDKLQKHLTEVQPDFIRPERYKNEILAMLREPVEDLCISRPKSRLQWGIELPFDKNFVTYVWFDALLNYVTGLDYPTEKFDKFWPVCEHIVGKDIVKPHGLFWPTMLMAAGLPLYKHLNVHGYWITPTGKMSKSLGNVVSPDEVASRYGMDVFRFFCFREMVFGLDGVFSWEAVNTRYTADLANNLGNLVSRSIAMLQKYRSGVVPPPGPLGESERELKANADTIVADVLALMKNMEVHRALERIWTFVTASNVYIHKTQAWTLAAAESSTDLVESDRASKELDTNLFAQLESLRIIAILISPFLPETSAKILSGLNYTAEPQLKDAAWGTTIVGKKVSQIEVLFPRKDLQEKKVMEQTTKEAPLKAVDAPTDEKISTQISYDDFSKIQLRVGQVMTAEKIEKSEKLLKLAVDLGEGKERQIIAGLAKYYTPETIVGRKVAVVANLKPAKLMGLMSEGMILASDDDGKLAVMGVDPEAKVGSIIK